MFSLFRSVGATCAELHNIQTICPVHFRKKQPLAYIAKSNGFTGINPRSINKSDLNNTQAIDNAYI